MIETLIGLIMWFGIASCGGFFLWLMANALAAYMLSSKISKERNEQDK